MFNWLMGTQTSQGRPCTQMVQTDNKETMFRGVGDSLGSANDNGHQPHVTRISSACKEKDLSA
jgi:hypothetical protein